jgi:hypothetical protein
MEEQLELHRGLLIRRRESVPKNCPEIDASAPVDHQLQAPRLLLREPPAACTAPVQGGVAASWLATDQIRSTGS